MTGLRGEPISQMRLAALAVAVLVASVAVVRHEGPIVSAQQQPPATALPNFSFDTRFELKPGAAPDFDRYWASLRQLANRGTPGHRRHVDGTLDGRLRLVSMPAHRLAEYGGDRRNEEALHETLGPERAQELLSAFNESQVARFSYIRQFVTALSVNRERHHRTDATEVVWVTVAERQEREFERVWRRAVDAYRRVPGSVLTVARTVAGDGPQFVVTRPLDAGAEEQPFDPVDGVRQVLGARAAASFASDLHRVVLDWKAERVVNLGLDAEPGLASAP